MLAPHCLKQLVLVVQAVAVLDKLVSMELEVVVVTLMLEMVVMEDNYLLSQLQF